MAGLARMKSIPAKSDLTVAGSRPERGRPSTGLAAARGKRSSVTRVGIKDCIEGASKARKAAARPSIAWQAWAMRCR